MVNVKTRYLRPANGFTTLFGLEKLKHEQIVEGVYRRPTGYVSFFDIENADGTKDLIDTGNDPTGFRMLGVCADGIKRVILTHRHRDHTRGAGALDEGTEVYAHKRAIDALVKGMRSEGFLPWSEDFVREKLHLQPAAKVPEGLDLIPLEAGMLEDAGYHIFEAFGHTSDSIVIARNGVLFAQDVLDVTNDGEIRPAFLPVTHSRSENIETVAGLSRVLEESGVSISAIAPAHSGTLRDPEALARFAFRYGVSA